MIFLKKNKFKILWITIFFILVFSFFSSSLGVENKNAECEWGRVTVNCLNIRCGPGIKYKKIGKINKNEYIEIYAQIDDWYVIKTEDNIVGTVSSKYIELVEEKIENDITSVDNLVNDLNSLGLTEDEQIFLNLINANRENNGLPELEIDSEVQNIARLKANDLVENNYFAHTSERYGDIPAMLNDFGINYKTVGENIAGNNNISGAVEAWMNSEKHRENVLSTVYNYTGVAVVESELYGKIFVQVFVGK